MWPSIFMRQGSIQIFITNQDFYFISVYIIIAGRRNKTKAFGTPKDIVRIPRRKFFKK